MPWIAVCIEAFVCASPTAFYWLTGSFIFPHQLGLLMDGEISAWMAVAYYPGCTLFLAAIVGLLMRLRNPIAKPPGQWILGNLAIGTVSLALGPAGNFMAQNYRDIEFVERVLFLLLPLGLSVHLLSLVYARFADRSH